MSQTWTDDVFATDHQGTADLQNIENNLAALKSMFSGASAPSNAVAGMPWYHTSKGMRNRNAGNSAWLKLLQGDAASKTWFYRNDTAEGWLIDASVTDKVIAIKGGSAAYNVSGGATAGSHTISGLSAANESAHTHGSGSLAVNTYHRHTWGASAGGGVTAFATDIDTAYLSDYQGAAGQAVVGASAAGAAHNHTISHDGSTRLAAAVGTLQYPDLS